MTTAIATIHEQIDRLTDRRTELWHVLSAGRDPQAVDELKAIEAKLAELWDAHRAERARLRFGERDQIVKRARAEERLERAA